MDERFDRYAERYDEALDEALGLTGETKDYFARGRVAWLSRRLQRLGQQVRTVLDFGCGTGSATPFLLEMLEPELILGVDVSAKSIEVAARTHGSPHARFCLLADYAPSAEFDLAFCNGVFHHIPVAERPSALEIVYRSLVPGGLFAFWENNPWNPGTVYTMRRCEFDADAETLSPRSALDLLQQAGFHPTAAEYLFFFPRFLRRLRFVEPYLSRLPLGGQYLVLCRKLERSRS